MNEYHIINKLQEMTMVSNAHKIRNNSDKTVANLLITGFTRQLKGWWDNVFTKQQQTKILETIQVNESKEPILDSNNETIEDAVSILIYNIAKYFVGDPTYLKDRTTDQLSNLRCQKLQDFRWYKDTFMTKVLTREDANHPYWKEKFITRLPTLFAEKIKSKYREKHKVIFCIDFNIFWRLSTANGENLSVKFKIPDVHICNNDICIKHTFILVKDLEIRIILGQPFLEIIKPFKVKNEGLITKIFQRKILFAFNEKPITKINLLKTLSMFKEHLINLIKTKENHLYFMKQEISNKKLEEQLQTSQIQEKIISLKINITNNLYFSERSIPTKARPIQMTYELMEHCKKQIEELLNKKLIRASKSPW
ncbi:LOW QUALITY PROTEIN: hypothetical protein CFOL_v3_21918, partial [Cephalotus follicularis]